LELCIRGRGKSGCIISSKGISIKQKIGNPFTSILEEDSNTWEQSYNSFLFNRRLRFPKIKKTRGQEEKNHDATSVVEGFASNKG
jgi:hypothetical protein